IRIDVHERRPHETGDVADAQWFAPDVEDLTQREVRLRRPLVVNDAGHVVRVQIVKARAGIRLSTVVGQNGSRDTERDWESDLLTVVPDRHMAVDMEGLQHRSAAYAVNRLSVTALGGVAHRKGSRSHHLTK